MSTCYYDHGTSLGQDSRQEPVSVLSRHESVSRARDRIMRGMYSTREGITVRNTYFESTPLELFRGIITESGLLRQEDVVALERRRWDEAVEAFGLEPVTCRPATTIEH